jgi:SAM-dependent methyltransferase
MILRRFFVKLGDLSYYKALESELAGARSVLDIGCGSWSPLANVRKSFYSVGIDIHKPSINEIKKKKIHDKYKIGDVLKVDKYFKPKSFDVVIALDVVEHFEKKDGLSLIEQMEKIAKKKVIILTPYGFTIQHPQDGNPFQEHKSGWNIEDFEKRGYRVFGMRGFRFIRTGEYATIKYKPWFFWGLISALSQLFTYYFPQSAYQLFAVKTIRK